MEPLFDEIWVVDFEFHGAEGDLPIPVCMVAREMRSGRMLRVWQDELRSLAAAPFSVGINSLVVCYYAPAEWGCFLELGWPLPQNAIDLFAEFRCWTNGLELLHGKGLLGAMSYFGLGGMAPTEKQQMRDLILSGGPWSVQERCAILLYCEQDVAATSVLFQHMTNDLDVHRALIRGRYTTALAKVERKGVPVDAELLRRLVELEPDLRDFIVAELGHRYGCFVGHTFRRELFTHWCEENAIDWPLLESGVPALDKETFKNQAIHFPEVRDLAEARELLKQTSIQGLAVGRDGRNRAMLSPFGGKTGRNQPSTRKYIFGRPKWMRGVIRPEPGMALALVDWSQQEFGIAAALSGDEAMISSYLADDPYVEFARLAGAVPADATKSSHPKQRELFKTCALGVLFGMGEVGLAARLMEPVDVARKLLRAHQRTYSQFHEWMGRVLDHASTAQSLVTAFGWRLHVPARANERSLRNFPMQANGAEMMRVALCEMPDDVSVIATIHDAFLIEAPEHQIEEKCALVRATMARASEIVLGGVLTLRSDAEIILTGQALIDRTDSKVWSWIERLLEEGAAE